MNEQDDREQALRLKIWEAGYELIGPRHENGVIAGAGFQCAPPLGMPERHDFV